jgi:GTPase SAR1 family protein
MTSLRARTLAALQAALDIADEDPQTGSARSALSAHYARYQQKMGVALVGRVSSGKSTLANALLGGDYAPTGIGELTYNVSWLRHGDQSGVTVHFTNEDRPPDHRPRGALEALAARGRDDPPRRDYLSAISYLEVTDPNPRLIPFDLVDTPGLDAASGEERARKTMEFLGRTAEGVRAQTVAFASQADALVIVSPKALSVGDAQLAADFTNAGMGVASPLTAVGVLTKIETGWRYPMPDPVAEGRQRARALLDLPGMRDVLFEIRPLAGKMAAGASLITEADLADLAQFADMTSEALGEAVRFAPAFAKAPYPDLPLPPGRRGELLNLLSGYGLCAAAALLRDGIATTVAELTGQLEELSGLTDLRALLLGHFARRADIIKARRVLDDVATLPRRLLAGAGPQAVNSAWRAVAQVTRLEQLPAFAQLAVLRDYWQGHLTLNDAEAEELLRIVGERGPDLTARLGVPPGTTACELAAAAAARHDHWSHAAQDPRYRGETRTACKVILSAYDDITDEIERQVADA